MIWRYLAAAPEGHLTESPDCLCRKIVRWSDTALSLEMLLTCLNIFADVGLLETRRLHRCLDIRLLPVQQKADLQQSATLQHLMRMKEE